MDCGVAPGVFAATDRTCLWSLFIKPCSVLFGRTYEHGCVIIVFLEASFSKFQKTFYGRHLALSPPMPRPVEHHAWHRFEAHLHWCRHRKYRVNVDWGPRHDILT